MNSSAKSAAAGPSLAIVARAVQGAGAALMMPTALAIVSAVYPQERKGTALGILAGASAFFAALGPVLGGALTSIDWRLVFLVNVPLALITINPARQLGIDARVGSIEVGKDADLAIFSANPLSVYAICQRTIVDGVVRFDRDRDPDDMRIYVDPKGSVEATTVRSQEEEDACMRGTEHLFHQQAE